MPKTCDRCGAINTVGHALQCKVGGLVILRHDEIANVLADLSMKALTPSAVRDEPRIHPHSRKLEKPEPTTQENPVQYCKAKSNDEDRGDILVRCLWQSGTDCIIDVCVTNINSKSQHHLTPAKALSSSMNARRSPSTWTLALSNDATSLPSYCQLTVNWEWKQKCSSSAYRPS
jgi:hypothetical protein